jgi:NADPH:quinone reductase-like Zn-dependent oxidoreductase
MKAAVQIAYGDIDSSVTLTDVPAPQPGSDDVVVRVRATTLNRKDLFALQNLTGPGIRPRPPLPHVHGGDCCGEIVECGRAVQGLAVGDRVVAFSGLFCGRCAFCAIGEETACLSYGALGEQIWGSHAQYVSIPGRNLVRVGPDVSLEALACAGGSWTTAWRALVTVANVRPAETVAIVGASGGVGTGAIRIAKLAGCRVIAIVGSGWKAERAVEIGADHAIDYNAESFRDRTLDLTDGLGADVVLDSVGAATWRDSLNSLRSFGRMVICGATSGDTPDISIREVYQRHRRILGAPLGNRTDFRRLVECLSAGLLKPVVHAVTPLDAICSGLHALERRASFGKIVLVPA